MDLWVAALIIVGAAAASVFAMLIVHRRAPAGTFFKDVVPAGAVYTVIGTAYMVIVAFVFFVALENYHAAKSDAQEEATATLAMFHAADGFGLQAGGELQRQVLCYAREVISEEWPAMREGGTSGAVERRVTTLEQDAERLPLSRPKQSAAFQHWVSLNEERRRGRQGQIAEAAPLVPPLVWLILIVGAVIVIGSVCLFADVDEARVPQAALIAGVAGLVVSALLLVRFLDRPLRERERQHQTDRDEEAIGLMGQTRRGGNREAALPCA